jgi:membrane-associated protease RseP (regulator of RpoE activity)
MDDHANGPSGPSPERFETVFHVRKVRTDGDRLLYFGQPLVPHEYLMKRVWPTFREAGYEVRFTTADRADIGIDAGTDGGRPSDPTDHWATPAPSRREHVLVAEPIDLGIDGIPWKNVVLALATVLSTLYAGALWYHIDLGANPLAIASAWPFTAAVMGVWGIHELGHYVMSRHHGVDATLPYFIPAPTLIGTMGAIIRMRGRMPDRRALFDIGVAGPLAGIVATVAVTTVGLFLGPIAVPESVQTSSSAVEIWLGFPPLMHLLSWVTGQPLSYEAAGEAVHPVVIGGWVGMFVTFLNMIPVGQLDGGHVLRAMLGPRQETVAALVPATLFGLAGFLHYVEGEPVNAVFVWLFWGLFSAVLAFVGPANPIVDESLDRKRVAVGILTVALGLLCFTPVPIAVIG